MYDQEQNNSLVVSEQSLFTSDGNNESFTPRPYQHRASTISESPHLSLNSAPDIPHFLPREGLSQECYQFDSNHVRNFCERQIQPIESRERIPVAGPYYTRIVKDIPKRDSPKSNGFLFSTPAVSASHNNASPNHVPKRISGTCKKGPKGANLFVYHLPCEVDNEDLVTLFSFFGPLLSVKVESGN